MPYRDANVIRFFAFAK